MSRIYEALKLAEQLRETSQGQQSQHVYMGALANPVQNPGPTQLSPSQPQSGLSATFSVTQRLFGCMGLQ